ncbi:unnamed protein product [Aphanomyces euteiches]|uniref:Myosin motor domain-containing protein n=1 Tax=Aphanomyces euteiches TaxID=100861 RepID=A0A6G0XKV9_9STRA|nr:hypothetical protein Ae201684_003566 [Aphanomyces euteiches]KAH9084465.1 hypothetical protein Ae201684P_001707 [Aphanomyces euteiches]KAH9145094.1 hypothetical protein AeRB84_010985 [Aphanomyces euteiches]
MAVRLEHIQEWIEATTDMRMDGDMIALLKDGQILCKLANSLNAAIRVNKLKTTFHCKENITGFLQWAQRMQVPEQDLFTPDDLLWGDNPEVILRTLSTLYEMFAEEIRASVACPPDHSPRSLRSNSGDSEGWSSDDSGLGDLHDDDNEDIAESFVVREYRSSSKFAAFMQQIPEIKSPVAASPPKTALLPPQTTAPSQNKMAAFLAKTPITPPVVIPAPSSRRMSSESPPSPPKEQPPPEPVSIHMSKPRGPPKTSARNPVNSTPKVALTIDPEAKEPAATASPPLAQPRPNDPRSNLAKLLMQNVPKPQVQNDDILTPPSSPKVHTSLQKTPLPSPPPAPAQTVTLKAAIPSPTPTKPLPQTTPVPKPAPSQPNPPVSTAPSAAKPVNKLAGFLAKVPSSAPPAASSAGAVSKLSAFMSNSSTGFKPSAPAKSTFRPAAQSLPAARKVSKSLRCPRSSGSFNWVRKRQTYVPTSRPVFDKEAARQRFMKVQAAIKAEQKSARGGADKKVKNVNGCVPGMLCYVPDEAETWVLAEVDSFDTRRKHVRVKILRDGSSRTVDLKNPEVIRAVGGTQATEIDSLPLAIAHHEGVQDMRNLRFLNEPSILYNLKSRFEAAQPYTYSNEIVIAVNPYQWLPSLYGESLHEKYLSKPRESLPPHVYATSTSAYKHMMSKTAGGIRNQSILVSGESGAGKTETTKILMHHLATVAGGREDSTIARVIDVNPLLESFGNAKTTRNDNSSRFGKFTQLQFDAQGRLRGGRCETYLLEKSRVVSFTEGERNYHIFYQLLAGLSPTDQKKLHLDPMHQYHYTGLLGNMQIDGMDDASWLQKTEKALGLIDMNEAFRWTLYNVLAGILHLGEITFLSKSETTSAVANADELAIVSQLLGLPSETIEHAFCNRTIASNRESVTVPLNVVEALENRDALAKAIYANLFDWLVRRINEAIAVETAATQIGVLDIFGFEDFKHNGFEQFCINYANEKLQQKFVKDVFSSVQDEYIREGLAWDHIQYADNQDILNLIEGKLGVISLMNDHIRQPRGTEEALVNKIRTHSKDSPVISFAKVKKTQFTIKHYAGAVTYESVGFMEKHRDALMPDLLTLVQSSSVEFVVSLFPNEEPEPAAPEKPAEAMPSIVHAWNNRRKGKLLEKPAVEEVVDKAFGSRRKAVPPKTLGQQFKTSLSKLMETIEATNVHYVRCIKPNSIKSPVEFDKPMVVSQLRSAGVIDAIRISRAGYPSRLTANELATRYALMFPPSMVRDLSEKETCSCLLRTMGFNMPVEYQMGKTLVYFKAGALEELEALKSDFEYEQATVLQKIVLGFIARRKLARQIKAAIKLQAFGRCVIEMAYLRRVRHAVTSVKVAFRYRKIRVELLARIEAAAQRERERIEAEARLVAELEAQPEQEPEGRKPPKLDRTNWNEPSPRSSHSTPLTSPEAATSEGSFGAELSRAKQAESDAMALLHRSDDILAANKRFEAEVIDLRQELARMTKENERLRQLLKEHKINPDPVTPSSGKWL